MLSTSTTSLEKSFLLNTARPSVSLYAVPAGVYDTALTPVELGITDSQLQENDISLDTEFLAFSIDGLRQQRVDATVRGYVDAFGNPVIERNSEGEIEKYARFSRDIKFAETVNASERLPIAKKQEIIAMYNDNIRAGISRGMTLNELGVDILNAALAAEISAETATAVGLGTAVDPNLIKARTEALKRIEEDKQLGNYVFGQGIQMITASEGSKDRHGGKFRFESIMDKTADELGVDPTVLKELVGRNFSYVEDMVDYSLDPVTYLFGAVGVGLVNFVRYFGGLNLFNLPN